MTNNQTKRDGLQIGGVLRGRLIVANRDLDDAVIQGVGQVHTPRLLPQGLVAVDFGGVHNAFVNQGLQRVLDSAYSALTAARISHIALSGDTTAVTAATTTIGSPNSIKTAANVVRTGQTVAADQTWTQADVAFAITKIGLLTSGVATDVVNIIGGTAGVNPYDEPFTIDLTNIGSWTLTMGVDVTASAS